jgi:hypothetical protein
MSEVVSHTSLTGHSAPFSLSGGGTYSANLSGTLAIGTDPIELQKLVNGAWVSLDPPIRFTALDRGGTKTSGPLPAGTYRWTVPGAGHSLNTNVTRN